MREQQLRKRRNDKEVHEQGMKEIKRMELQK